MNLLQSRNIWVVPAISLVLSALAPRVSANESRSANQVIQLAVARAKNRSAVVGQPSYVYTKVTVREELDPAGKVTERQEKVYEVQFEAGSTFLKLIEVNGRPLAAADIK